MATTTRRRGFRAVTPTQWTTAAVGGFLGSVPLGLMMQYGNPEPLLAAALPAMYGLGYVAAVQWAPFAARARTGRGALELAVATGVVTTAVFSVLVMPLWLDLVGYSATWMPPFPDLTMPEKLWSVLGHVLYALAVTLGYALVTEA